MAAGLASSTWYEDITHNRSCWYKETIMEPSFVSYTVGDEAILERECTAEEQVWEENRVCSI